MRVLEDEGIVWVPESGDCHHGGHVALGKPAKLKRVASSPRSRRIVLQ
jgi:hypothetical protein